MNVLIKFQKFCENITSKHQSYLEIGPTAKYPHLLAKVRNTRWPTTNHQVEPAYSALKNQIRKKYIILKHSPGEFHFNHNKTSVQNYVYRIKFIKIHGQIVI